MNNLQAQVEGGITCYTPEVEPLAFPTSCSDLADFIPSESTPVLTVKLAFHIMQRESPNPKGNFDENNQADVDFLNAMFDRLNTLYAEGQEQWCDCDYIELSHTRDSKIQFELDNRIYYHQDETGYVNGNGTEGNTYNFNNYATCGDEILNIFFCQPPLNTASGIAFPTFVSMFNWYEEYQQGNANPWGAGNLLGHEIGHTFGLSHSYCGGLLADMCQSEYQNCQNGGKFCSNRDMDCTCGNNMMSYSKYGDYISPLQMATMHRRLTQIEGSSKFLKLEVQQTPVVIDQQGVEWDLARIMQNDVHIQTGASLTITCRLVMAKDARIIVKRGARLIVDGGLITSKGPTSNDCDGNETLEFPRWLGIEVWGNTTVSTSTAMLSESFPLEVTDPGVVIFKNGAIIEHARIGIFPQQRGTAWEVQLEHFGGLISSDNAEFRDCWKGVEYISHFPIRNSSQFINTRFAQTYLNTSLPFPLKTNFNGLSSWQVKGLTFIDCDFLNLNSGITVLNADFTIEGSLFQRSQRGIYIGSSTPGLGLLTEIGDKTNINIFENCDYPISVLSYDLTEIDHNLIRASPIGIYVEGPSGTIIEYNELQNNNSSNNPAMSIGIALTQTGEGRRNLIRCNEWTGTTSTLIRDGILVHGNNQKTLFHDNVFRSKYDVKVVQYDANQVQIPGRLPDQHIGSTPFLNAVYNEFTDYSTATHSAEIHTPNPFNPNGPLTLPFAYVHSPGICPVPNVMPPILGSKYIPRRPLSGTCANIFTSPYNFSNKQLFGTTTLNCPDIAPRPILLIEGECKSLMCLDSIYPQITQYKNIINTGDASNLYSSIQTDPNGTSNLNALVSASPWLSDGVLHEILTSGMSESNKRNILAQNIPLPQQILAQSQQALTAQGYSYLEGLHTTGISSARDSVQGQLTSLINYKDALLHHLVDSLVTMEEHEEADDLLVADGGRIAREKRVGLLIANGDLIGAKNFLSTWPATSSYDLEFSMLHALYLDHAIDGNLPSSADSAVLMDIALYSPYQAARAKTLAGAFYGILFDPLLPTDDTPQAFSIPPPSVPSVTAFDEINASFEVFPNPTTDALQVYMDQKEIREDLGNHVIISIFDTQGSRMLMQHASSVNTTIDTSPFPHGVYIMSAHRGDRHLGVRRFIKQ